MELPPPHFGQNNLASSIPGYLKEQWPYLIRVLEDGRLELSNNLAERSIKPFVIGRKNFLFANTPHGAQGSAVIYSLIETVKVNALDPYRYLVWGRTNALILVARGDGWASNAASQSSSGLPQTPDLKWTDSTSTVHFEFL